MIRLQSRWQILFVALILLWLFGCSDEETQKVLKYAFCPSPCTSSTNWIKVTVDTAEETGQYTSLALDSEDEPSISYYDGSHKDLKVATCTFDCNTASPIWSVITVDETGDVGRYTSLKLDSSGNPHISYYDATEQDLRYAFFNGTEWSIAIVNSEGDVGQYTTLVLQDDKPRIAYYDRTNGIVKLALCDANCDSSGWASTIVDSTGTIPPTVERAVSLVLDSDGNPRVAYYDVNGGNNLKYAACAEGCTTIPVWAFSTADDSVNDAGQYPSLVLDSDDKSWIGYYDATGGDLKLVSCIDNCDGEAQWSAPTLVDSQGAVGLFGSLVLDATGILQIAYYDLSFDALKYASCNRFCTETANWRTMTVDKPRAGRFSSLTVDSNNSPAISYWAEE